MCFINYVLYGCLFRLIKKWVSVECELFINSKISKNQ